MSAWVEAERFFDSQFKGKDTYVFTFKDTRAEMGQLRGNVKVLVGQQPADRLVCQRGHWFFAEIKSSASSTSFSFDGVRPAQWAAAARTVAAGGEYWFYIKAEASGAWYRVPALFMIEARTMKASVKWEHLVRFKHDW